MLSCFYMFQDQTCNCICKIINCTGSLDRVHQRTSDWQISWTGRWLADVTNIYVIWARCHDVDEFSRATISVFVFITLLNYVGKIGRKAISAPTARISSQALKIVCTMNAQFYREIDGSVHTCYLWTVFREMCMYAVCTIYPVQNILVNKIQNVTRICELVRNWHKKLIG